MRDPLPAPERHPSLTLIAVGSEIGADRIAWDVAEQINTVLDVELQYCRSPVAELPSLLTQYSDVVLLDALLTDSESERGARELKVSELMDAHSATASHGLGVGDTLKLLHALDRLPANITVIGLPIGIQESIPSPTRIIAHATSVIDLIKARTQSPTTPARKRIATPSKGR